MKTLIIPIESETGTRKAKLRVPNAMFDALLEGYTPAHIRQAASTACVFCAENDAKDEAAGWLEAGCCAYCRLMSILDPDVGDCEGAIPGAKVANAAQWRLWQHYHDECRLTPAKVKHAVEVLSRWRATLRRWAAAGART